MNILLHMCCSNCSLYPVRMLREEGHALLGFWYNPNIHPLDEYELRLGSLKRLSEEWKIDVAYDESRPEEYFGLFMNKSETDSAGDAVCDPLSRPVPAAPDRCRACYGLRLDKAASLAREEGLDGFTTTLLISPYQDQDGIIRTGKLLEKKYGVMFYEKDFRPHFRDAMNLSKEMGLYRQKYCGCIFSKAEREFRAKNKE